MTGKAKTLSEHLLRGIKSIPILGFIFSVLNAYAYAGDLKADARFAPWYCWLKTYWAGISISFFLSLISSPKYFGEQCFRDSCLRSFPESLPIEPLVISILPNLLGFGIGAYALVFSLNRGFIKKFHALYQVRMQRDPKFFGSVFVLNVDFAMPLCLMAFDLFIAAANLGISSPALSFVVSLFFWLSLYWLFELISSLYHIGSTVMSNNIQ